MDVDAAGKATTGFPYTTTSELAFLYHRAHTPAEPRQTSQPQSSYPPSTTSSLFRQGTRRRLDSTESSEGHVAGASLYNLASAKCSQSSLLSSTSTHSAYSQLKQSFPRLWRRGGSKNRSETDFWDVSRPSSPHDHFTSFLPHSSASDSGDVEALDDVSSQEDEEHVVEHKSWALPHSHRHGSAHPRSIGTASLQRSNSSSQLLSRPQSDRSDEVQKQQASSKVVHQRSYSSMSVSLQEQRCDPSKLKKETQSSSDLNEHMSASGNPSTTSAVHSTQQSREGREVSNQSDRGTLAPQADALTNGKKSEHPRAMSKLKQAAHRALARVNHQHDSSRHRRNISGTSSGWDEEGISSGEIRERQEAAAPRHTPGKPQPRDEIAAFELGRKRSQSRDKQKERQLRRNIVEHMSGSSHDVLNESSRSASGSASKQTTSGSSTSSHTRSCVQRARQRQYHNRDYSYVPPSLYQSILGENEGESKVPCTCHVAPGREGDWTRETTSKSSSGKAREHHRSQSSSVIDGGQSCSHIGRAHRSRHGQAMPAAPANDHINRGTEGRSAETSLEEAGKSQGFLRETPTVFPPRSRSLRRVRRHGREAAEDVVPA